MSLPKLFATLSAFPLAAGTSRFLLRVEPPNRVDLPLLDELLRADAFAKAQKDHKVPPNELLSGELQARSEQKTLPGSKRAKKGTAEDLAIEEVWKLPPPTDSMPICVKTNRLRSFVEPVPLGQSSAVVPPSFSSPPSVMEMAYTQDVRDSSLSSKKRTGLMDFFVPSSGRVRRLGPGERRMERVNSLVILRFSPPQRKSSVFSDYFSIPRFIDTLRSLNPAPAQGPEAEFHHSILPEFIYVFASAKFRGVKDQEEAFDKFLMSLIDSEEFQKFRSSRADIGEKVLYAKTQRYFLSSGRIVTKYELQQAAPNPGMEGEHASDYHTTYREAVRALTQDNEDPIRDFNKLQVSSFVSHFLVKPGAAPPATTRLRRSITVSTIASGQGPDHAPSEFSWEDLPDDPVEEIEQEESEVELLGGPDENFEMVNRVTKSTPLMEGGKPIALKPPSSTIDLVDTPPEDDFHFGNIHRRVTRKIPFSSHPSSSASSERPGFSG